MPPRSKVELYAAIRRDARAGLSNQALQREYGVGFRTVKTAISSVWPEPRKKPRTRPTRLDPRACITSRTRSARNTATPSPAAHNTVSTGQRPCISRSTQRPSPRPDRRGRG